MENLELYQLAKYLPYEPKIANLNKDGSIFCYEVLDSSTFKSCQNDEHRKLVLRPLSDLIVERDGKIDLVELAKIAYPKAGKYIRLHNDHCFIDSLGSYCFYFTEGHFGCTRMAATSCDVPNQLQLFEYLYSHHYDVYGLIDKSLAIDINTI